MSRSAFRQDGFTLVELLVVCTVMAIVFSLVGITTSVVLQQTTAQARSNTSASSAQSSVDEIGQYIRGIVNPFSSALADNTGHNGTSTAPTACWGSNAPSVPTGALYEDSSGNPAVPKPIDTALVVAHDFDAVFCAYPPRSSLSSSPHVYRIWIDPSTCKSNGAQTGGSCTLKVDDYGSAPSCTWSPSGPIRGSTSTCSTPPVTAFSVAGVWCNLSCQQDVNGTLVGTLTTTPLFNYYATSALGVAGTTPMDDMSVNHGSALVNIHDIRVSLSILTNVNAQLPAPGGRPGSTATVDDVFLASTVTQS